MVVLTPHRTAHTHTHADIRAALIQAAREEKEISTRQNFDKRQSRRMHRDAFIAKIEVRLDLAQPPPPRELF